MPRILLHACCGPCVIEPLEALKREGDVDVAFANPNIQPGGEHQRRLSTLADYLAGIGVNLLPVESDPAEWSAACGHVEVKAERCAACYRMRMERIARMAAGGGYDAVATTLTVSPYQDQDSVRAAAQAACSAVGLDYLDRDFRDRYRRAVERSRELGMYRQRYCGCLPSIAEAERDRRTRRGG